MPPHSPSRVASLLVGLAVLATSGLAQVIDFETLPNGTPTADLQHISNEYAAPPFGVTFAVVDRNTGAFVAAPRLAKVGAPRTAFQGCTGADDPLPNAGVCQTFLTDDAVLGSIGNLEVTYTSPVVRASAILLDIDAYSGTIEQWTITARDAAGNVVDMDVLSPIMASPCGSYPGNGTASVWSVESPTGAAEIATILIAYTGTAPVNGIGFAFDNFSPSEGGLGAPVAGCTAVPNSSGFPARVVASGSPNVVDNNLRLTAQGLPQNASGYFLTSLTVGVTPNPAGSQGDLCLAGSIGRLNRPGEVQNGGACGLFDLTIDLSNLPTPTGATTAMVGETRSFQCWYRDTNPGPVSNFSDAVSLTLQ